MKELLKKYDCFLFESYRISDENLSMYRIFFCIASLFFHVIPSFLWISHNSPYILFPPKYSFTSLFTSFPPYYFFYFINISILILYTLLLFGWYTRIVSVLLTVLTIIGCNFSYSFGKIDHNIMLVATPLILAFSGWGNCYSIDGKAGRKQQNNSWLVTLHAFCLGFAMFTASIPKLLKGWLLLDSHAVKARMIHNISFYEGNRSPMLFEPFMKISNSFFWESLDYLTIIFEAGFLIAVLWPLVFRYFVISALLFHLFVYLTFQIVFTGNLVAYALYLSWGMLSFVHHNKKFNDFFSVRNLLIVLALILVFNKLFITDGLEEVSVIGKLLAVIIKDPENARIIEVMLQFVIAIVMTLYSIVYYIKNKPQEPFVSLSPTGV